MTEEIDYYKIAGGMAIFDATLLAFIALLSQPVGADAIGKVINIILAIIFGIILGFFQSFGVWLYVRISNFTIKLLKPIANIIPGDRVESTEQSHLTEEERELLK
jgi:hypothetical protein